MSAAATRWVYEHAPTPASAKTFAILKPRRDPFNHMLRGPL